ncbi:MAG: Extracellular nuclease [Parcubacteria group bacterium GW2011_GWF2_39_8b]|uniref:Ada DNA repair metal-binding domain-containing protein n=1 Tax=Candidatus Zambryskibacteria bacterium RIFCSPLOWO2_12_39_8 TaxID=1802774 RepID=A0A1G2UWF1_9BACT|nr:MAG: Extracellular nuclease [Parcubacteria group bacterium GW2011_GWF2_39_8b]OHB13622.1 MAG: hypothetical protein A2Y49_02380 [Candidatus Zambryskibacteria bacterium RIFCSPLOWO2_12_39_8]
MSIQETLQKIKPFYTLLLILVIASIFFALGQLSALEDKHTPIKIKYNNQSQTSAVVNSADIAEATISGQVIGVKSSKKYYFPWCGTIKRVKPENQVPFADIESAKAAGYIPGGNCKGLK